MGAWIRRGWISCFGGSPILRPDVPKPFTTSIFQCDAKGGTQKGIGHFFLFRSPFGNHFVTFSDAFGHFFAYPLLPPPFCGRVNFETSGLKIGAAQKSEFQLRRIQPPPFSLNLKWLGGCLVCKSVVDAFAEEQRSLKAPNLKEHVCQNIP